MNAGNFSFCHWFKVHLILKNYLFITTAAFVGHVIRKFMKNAEWKPVIEGTLGEHKDIYIYRR